MVIDVAAGHLIRDALKAHRLREPVKNMLIAVRRDTLRQVGQLTAKGRKEIDRPRERAEAHASAASVLVVTGQPGSATRLGAS